jgi:hypothetical protein
MLLDFLFFGPGASRRASRVTVGSVHASCSQVHGGFLLFSACSPPALSKGVDVLREGGLPA